MNEGGKEAMIEPPLDPVTGRPPMLRTAEAMQTDFWAGNKHGIAMAKEVRPRGVIQHKVMQLLTAHRPPGLHQYHTACARYRQSVLARGR